MTTFPRTRRSRRGYDTDEVDAFLARARSAYESEKGEHHLTAAELRRTAFSLRRGGYSPRDVDAALDRLEDAFAQRESEARRGSAEAAAFHRVVDETAETIIAHLRRPRSRRFARTSLLAHGYSRSDVDRFTSRLLRHLESGAPMSVEQVRTVVFRPRRRGYKEHQVDALLDAAVEVLLARGTS